MTENQGETLFLLGWRSWCSGKVWKDCCARNDNWQQLTNWIVRRFLFQQHFPPNKKITNECENSQNKQKKSIFNRFLTFLIGRKITCMKCETGISWQIDYRKKIDFFHLSCESNSYNSQRKSENFSLTVALKWTHVLCSLRNEMNEHMSHVGCAVQLPLRQTTWRRQTRKTSKLLS